MTMCVDSILAQIERAERLSDWLAPVRRSCVYGPWPVDNKAPNHPNGRVVVNDELAQTEIVQRNWRERLLSLTPWRRFKQVPGKPVFWTDRDGVIYTCARGADSLRREILKAEELVSKDAAYLAGLGIVP